MVEIQKLREKLIGGECSEFGEFLIEIFRLVGYSNWENFISGLCMSPISASISFCFILWLRVSWLLVSSSMSFHFEDICAAYCRLSRPG